MSVESSYSKKGFLLLLWLLSVSNEDTPLTATEALMASVFAVCITDTTRHMKAIFFK